MNFSHSIQTPSPSHRKLTESDQNINISCKTSTQETKQTHPLQLKYPHKNKNQPRDSAFKKGHQKISVTVSQARRRSSLEKHRRIELPNSIQEQVRKQFEQKYGIKNVSSVNQTSDRLCGCLDIDSWSDCIDFGSSKRRDDQKTRERIRTQTPVNQLVALDQYLDSIQSKKNTPGKIER